MDMFDGRAGVWVTICKNPGASGRLLLVKHGNKVDAHKGRVQLSAWLSDDERVTWNGGLILDERKGISYPDGFQAPDGILYISYDRNRATEGEILMPRVTEADVLARQLVAPKSKLKMPISGPLGRKQTRVANESCNEKPLVAASDAPHRRAADSAGRIACG